MRIARVLAMLLALATLAVSAVFLQRAPNVGWHVVPAVLGVLFSLIFWRKAPAKKKARRRAALASLAVVPCMWASAVLGRLMTPLDDWPIFMAFSGLALMLAIYALAHIRRKQSHPWADYYQELS